MTQAHTYTVALWVWRVRRWASQEVSETHTNAPTLACLYLVQSIDTSGVFPQNYFTANHQDSGMPSTLLPLCHHPTFFHCWPTPPRSLWISIYRNLSKTFTFLHLHILPCTHWLKFNTYTQHSHWRYTPTNVTFDGHSLSCKLMHTYNTLLHREPCCVLSGGTQMAATWCVLMGSCDGSGQDMDTHRWRPTESGWEMDVPTIDLLRSMIHNLVIWHWGSCTHWAGTSAWHIGHTSLRLRRVQVN